MNAVHKKEELEKKLQKEYEKLVNNKWSFLNNDYKLTGKIGYHRTELQEIKNIAEIKKEIEDKIGVLATFVFITDFCSKFKLPGPYKDIDKALIIIYHMICGVSINQMVLYLNVSNYFKLYKYLYITKYDELNKWINEIMFNCFSNLNIRLLTARINNPELVKHVTLLMDGHHNKIIYENIDINKEEMYSWKLKKSGLNTQFIIDINKIVIFVSESLPCRDNNDDLMFINNIDFSKFFSIYDNICFDGLYENTLLETVEKYGQANIEMDLSNFTYPIKKDKNIDLEENEEKFNKYCGGFRSTVETYFSYLGKVFKRFHGQTNVRVTKFKTYNIQLRLACLLLNLKTFSEISNLVIPEKCYSWTRKSFDYPHQGIIPKTEKIVFKFTLAEKINNKQSDLLNAIMYDNTPMNIDDANNNIIKDLSVGDYLSTVNSNKKNKLYEVQYIISHKINASTNEKEYFVKWRKYPKQHNSWVKESDFNEREIIDNYYKSLMEED